MLSNHALKKVSKKILAYNRKFLNLHCGESCYIFGNGASIKYFDLRNFGDKIGIGIGALDCHKDFNALNVKYFYEGQPFFYYPFWTNPYSKRFEKNIIGKFYKKKTLSNPNISHFMSISNFFGLRQENVFFVHHFRQPFAGFDSCRLDNNFTCMGSGLGGMIGLAINLGFKDITLIGCDYTFYPQALGHFYEYGDEGQAFWEKPVNQEFLAAAQECTYIRTLVPDSSYRGHMIPSVTYEELTGCKPVKKENIEICNHEALAYLDKSRMNYKIFPAQLKSSLSLD